MITVSINAHPDIEDKINNYVKENNINLNQVILDLILEKIEDEEDYKLAVEAYEEYKLNKEKAISFEDLVKKWDWKMKYKVIIRQKAEKQLNKQNFVKGKITKYECISFAIIFIIIN